MAKRNKNIKITNFHHYSARLGRSDWLRAGRAGGKYEIGMYHGRWCLNWSRRLNRTAGLHWSRCQAVSMRGSKLRPDGLGVPDFSSMNEVA